MRTDDGDVTFIRRNKRSRIILYQHNAGCNKSHLTTDYLSTQTMGLMCHLSYSFDLAPNNFVLERQE